jgi:hypothetical protein
MIVFTRKFFYKNGYIFYNFDWTKVFFFLTKFVLKYKFFFNLKANQTSFKIIPLKKQLENKFHFLKLFLKLNTSFKWTKLDFKKLHLVLEKIKKNSLKILVKQN